MDPRARTNRLIMLFVKLTQLTLLIRLLFSLFDADRTNSFVNWIYSMSGTLLEPIRGIYPPEVFDHRFVLEFRVLFAMAAYAVVGYAVYAIINWLPKPRNSKDDWRKWLKERLG